MWERNRQLIGIGHIILASGGLLAAFMVFTFVSLGGALSGDPLAIQITSAVAFGVSGLLVLLSLPGIIAGVGVLRRREWAKMLAVLVSVLNLLTIPFGTALGGYTLYVFFKDREDEEAGAGEHMRAV